MVKLKKMTPAITCAVKFKSGARCLTRVVAVGEMCGRHARTPPSVIVGRFSSIKRQSIRDRIRDIQRFETDALDLLPELELMRALLINWVEGYDELVEAITAWNDTTSPRERPAQVPKIEDVKGLVDTIAKLAARQNEIKNRSSITIEDFHRVLSAMGMAVATFVKDPHAVKQIEMAWGNLAIDSRHPLTKPQRQLNRATVIDVTPSSEEA